MNAAAPWLLPTNGRMTVTVKPGIGAYTRLRTLPEKQFPREHFAFVRQQKRFAREHFTFAREEKRFPRCRRTGVVFRQSVHPPADPACPSARVRRPGHSKSNNFFKNFREA